MAQIAFLGLGRMGAPMAARLLAAGHPLTVWNRTTARAEPLLARGARLAASPAQAVRDADVVLTMLATPDAVRDVARQIVPALLPGAHWVEMSTIGPDAVRELAAALPSEVTLVDAPVTGSTDKAEAGTLGILAGGEADPVEQLLSALGTVTRTGPLGTGAALKLVVNTAVLGAVALVGEAMRLADALGIPEETAKATLGNSALGGAVPRAFAEGMHFANDLAVKDIRLATEITDLPAMETIREYFAAHPGIAHEDIAAAVTRIRTEKP
ncbi:NAD(P)-dependent oxidoreductase [Streptomyces sp. TRM66268-LWL]|uniref:NAD(P)-dependent oxidoreductase n=1 Tax=Streptomyces polyasparticus TaxID=2767826 RepID=A0ABR7SVY5_9ACTN|nr:NAD(P)-dependent oxidoreductase [Streptomyces polyasparticus]MBC9719689.1 NAD(P)-dependent oxidoreductase [Streptomyces polyasparticus]